MTLEEIVDVYLEEGREVEVRDDELFLDGEFFAVVRVMDEA